MNLHRFLRTLDFFKDKVDSSKIEINCEIKYVWSKNGYLDSVKIEEPEKQNTHNFSGKSMEEIEKIHILDTLNLTNHNREEAAKILGIPLRTLYRKLQWFHLQRKDFPNIKIRRKRKNKNIVP